MPHVAQAADGPALVARAVCLSGILDQVQAAPLRDLAH